MWIQIIQKRFEAFKRKIQTVQKGFQAFEWKFEMNLKHSNANSNHSKWIQSIWMQIWTIQIGIKAFEHKF